MVEAPYARPKFQLLSELARANRCRAVLDTRSGVATVVLSLARVARVGLVVYDALGRAVLRVSAPEMREAGRHAIPLDTSALPPGLYVVRADAGGVGARVQPFVVAR